MRVSVSSVFITLIMVTVMGTLLSILLHQKKRFIFFRSDLLIILGVLILIRLLFPIELPFTHSIYIGALMNPIQSFFKTELVNGFSVLNLCCMIWALGSLICLFIYFRKIRISRQMLNNISQTAQKHKVSDFIKVDPSLDYHVWITDLISNPMVLGLKETILLPNKTFSAEELNVILHHEIQHVKNHDIYIKQVSNVLMILYWWFLPVYWLNNNLNLALEIRADAHATKGLNKDKVLNYAYTLIDVKDKSDDMIIDKSLSIFSSFFLRESPKVMLYRINYLINSSFKKRTNALFLVFIVLLPFISNAIILEPRHEYPYKNDGTYSETDLIQHAYLFEENGKYFIVMDGQKSEITNPDEFIKMGIPLRKEK